VEVDCCQNADVAECSQNSDVAVNDQSAATDVGCRKSPNKLHPLSTKVGL